MPQRNYGFGFRSKSKIILGVAWEIVLKEGGFRYSPLLFG